MNPNNTIRYALIAAVAAAVGVPLIAQVKNSQTAANAPADQAVQQNPFEVTPTTKPVDVDPSKVIASYGGATVTAGEFDAILSQLGPQAQMVSQQPALKKRLAENILQVKALAGEASKRKLDEKPDVKLQLEIQRDQILAQALQKQMQAGGEQEDRAYFDANKASFDKMKARHILIRTPGSPVPVEEGRKELTEAQARAKADDIEQRLSKDKGASFSDVAKAESDDKASGAKGGDLGEFSAWNMDSTFSKAAEALQPNQISQPIKTQFGYHIIQLLEDKPQTFEEAKTEVGQARLQSLVASLRTDAHFDPGFFGLPAESGATTRPASTEAPASSTGKAGT